MRIAYLTGEYPRATDTFIQREVAILRKQGIEVDTFSIRRTGDEHIVGPEQKFERENTYYVLPPNPWNLLISQLILLLRTPHLYLKGLMVAWQTKQPGIKGTLYQLFYFLEAGIVARQMKRRNIEHLHNHFANPSGNVTLIASMLGGFSCSFSLHGPAIFFEPKLWHLDRKIKEALFISCISYYCRSQAMVFAPMEYWDKMHVIHCGIEPDLFNKVSHQGQATQLLYVGRLAFVKGLPILLESLAQLQPNYPDLCLTVIGDGPEKEYLQQMVRELNLENQVKFVGYQSQESVRNYLQQTEIFVLSSFAEGLPVVLMEAMAAGVPVITTQIAGVSELVDNGINGYLVPPGNVAALTEKIEKLIVFPELRTQFSLKGRKKVAQEFNINDEVKRLSLVIRNSLKGEKTSIRPML
ncbi:MAG: glycosyltransferase [Crocosphaera sp.]|nr:glycosyltransferase [Crocosphaera sp.]